MEAEKKHDNSNNNQVHFDHKISIMQYENDIDNFNINDMDELHFDATPDKKKSFLGFDFHELSKRTSFSK